MKKLALITGLAFLTLYSNAQNNDDKTTTYTPLSQERFNQLEDLTNQTKGYSPIRIQEATREEIITFYIQGCSDDFVNKWMSFAYKKMTLANLITEGSKQDKHFKSLLAGAQTRVNMYQFMAAMSVEQIEAVGYNI